MRVANEASQAGGELFDFSQKTGVAVETLSVLKVAAGQTGSSLESVAASLGIFQKNIQLAAEGNKQMSTLFRTLKIDTTDTNTALSTSFTALSRLPEGFQQTALAMRLFGRGGKDVLAIVKESGGDFDNYWVRLEALGLVMSGRAAQQADEYGDAVDRLGLQFEAAKRAFAEEFIPALTQGMQALSNLLVNNQGTWRAWGAEVSAELLTVRARMAALVAFFESNGNLVFDYTIRERVERAGEAAAEVRRIAAIENDPDLQANLRRLQDKQAGTRNTRGVDSSVLGRSGGGGGGGRSRGGGGGKSETDTAAEEMTRLKNTIFEARAEFDSLNSGSKTTADLLELLAFKTRLAGKEFQGLSELQRRALLNTKEAEIQGRRALENFKAARAEMAAIQGRLNSELGFEKTLLEETREFLESGNAFLFLTEQERRLLLINAGATEVLKRFKEIDSQLEAGKFALPAPAGVPLDLEIPHVVTAGGDPSPEPLLEFQRLRDRIAEVSDDIGRIFGDAVYDWNGKFSDFFRSLASGFGTMFRRIIADSVQSGVSNIFKNILSGGASTVSNTPSGGGGGLFGSLLSGARNLFGGGGSTGGNLINPTFPTDGGSSASGLQSASTTARTGLLSQISNLFGGDGSTSSASGASRFSLGSLGKSLGSVLGPLAPFLGLQLGRSAGGEAGALGGALLGGAATAALAPSLFTSLLGGSFGIASTLGGILPGTSFGLGPAVAGLLTNPFTIAAGGALLLGGILLSRAKQRKRDESTRDQYAGDAILALHRLIGDLKHEPPKIDGPAAISQAEQIRASYVEQVNAIKTKSVRESAIRNQLPEVNRLVGLVPVAARDATARTAARQSIASQLRPTFADGGAVSRFMADGGALYNPLGYVQGPGTARSDSIAAYFPVAKQHAQISHTEYVLDAETTRNITVPRLDAIRANRGRNLADGGAVQVCSAPAMPHGGGDLTLHLQMNVMVGPEMGVKVLQAALATPDGKQITIKTVRADIKQNPSGIPADIKRARPNW